MHQKLTEYVEYFNYLGSVLTHDARCVSEIKSRVIKGKTTVNKKKNFLTHDARCVSEIKSRVIKGKTTVNKKKNFHQEIGLKFRKKPLQCYFSKVDFCGI